MKIRTIGIVGAGQMGCGIAHVAAIAGFDVDLKSRGIVYKRFWIVQTSDARLLVDSTTANWHPLKLEAA